MDEQNNKPEISIILPCQNEAKALPFCLDQIKKVIKENSLNAEIIVSDSSTDASPKIAGSDPAIILLKHDKNGYGNAYLEAFKIAKGKYIFMADADGTYDFNEIQNFLNYLQNGYDFAIGNRFSKKIEKGAITNSRKIGNFLLSLVLKLFFKSPFNDSQCGMRAISKKSLQKLNMRSSGMEFASEMIIKILQNNLKIKELPINYYKRKGKSKLNFFVDGCRHLKLVIAFYAKKNSYFS